MPRYMITWEIGPEQFGNPVEAAQWAWQQMRAPGSIANVFDVVDLDANVIHRVDLEGDEESNGPLVSRVDLRQVRMEASIKTTLNDLGDVLRRLQGGNHA